MQVQEYIKQLLYDHNCVILPDFGGFVANRYHSRVNLSQLRVEPPRKGIAFNRNLKTNDGLLADYISQKEEISFENASKWIADYVESLNQTLQNRKFAEVKGLGDFYLNSENNLVFVPDANANFLKESFGLFPVPLKPTNNVVENKIERGESIKQKANLNSSKTQIRRLSLGAVLVIIPALLTMLFYNSSLQNNPNINISSIFSFLHLNSETPAAPIAKPQPSKTNHQEVTIKQKEPDAVTPDSISTEVANTESQPIAVNSETVNNDATTLSPKPAILYHIIGGSFSVPANAENFLLELKGKGYPAYEAGRTKGGLIMIGYDKYSDEGQATQELTKIHNTENKQAWIYLQNQ